MRPCVVVEFWFENEEVLDLGNLASALGQNSKFKRDNEDGLWSFSETGDQMQWFDESDVAGDNEDEHTHEEGDAYLIGAAIVGEHMVQSATYLIRWFMENAETLEVDPDQFEIMLYYSEVE